MLKKEKLAIIIVTIAAAVGLLFIFSTSDSATEISSEVWRADAFSKGPADAKVKIVEFGDFQCPTCKTTAPILDSLLKSYPRDVALQWRYYPLTEHAHAREAALASLYTTSSDQFWNLHNLLFNTQDTWSNSTNVKEIFKQMLVVVRANADSYAKGSEDAKFNTVIDADLRFATKQQLIGTPSFFINGRLYDGELSEAALRLAVENEITNK